MKLTIFTYFSVCKKWVTLLNSCSLARAKLLHFANLLLITLLFLPQSSASSEKISQSSPFVLIINRPEGSPIFEWNKLIYEEVFRRLEIELIVQSQPLKRASATVNNGIADGEPARIHSYGKFYSNLIRVEEPVYQLSFSLYSRAKTQIPSWEFVRTNDLNIGFPRGMKIAEEWAKELKKNRLFPVHTTSIGLKILAGGRVDVYLDDNSSVAPLLTRNNKRFVNISEKLIIEKVPLYMFIHYKHKDLLPNLRTAIKSLKDDNSIEKFKMRAFEPTVSMTSKR